MKQTAVHELFLKWLSRDLTIEDFEQAKEMEKEQILKAYEDGYYGDVVKHEDEFKNYYNKTYGDDT